MKRFLWRVQMMGRYLLPSRPFWIWWAMTSSRKVWRLRWSISKFAYQFRNMTREQLEAMADNAIRETRKARATRL